MHEATCHPIAKPIMMNHFEAQKNISKEIWQGVTDNED
jgi:hypothetical protein